MDDTARAVPPPCRRLSASSSSSSQHVRDAVAVAMSRKAAEQQMSSSSNNNIIGNNTTNSVNKRHNKTKSVQFGGGEHNCNNVTVEVVEIAGRQELSRDAVAAIWWTAKETAELRQEAETVIYLMMESSQQQSQFNHNKTTQSLSSLSLLHDGGGAAAAAAEKEEHCIRGLETKTQAGAWALYEVQRDARNAVLAEQEQIAKRRRQSCRGQVQQQQQKDGPKDHDSIADADSDAECIARAYKTVTLKSRRAAYETGLRDQQEAQRWCCLLNGQQPRMAALAEQQELPKKVRVEEGRTTAAGSGNNHQQLLSPGKTSKRAKLKGRKISMPPLIMEPAYHATTNTVAATVEEAPGNKVNTLLGLGGVKQRCATTKRVQGAPADGTALVELSTAASPIKKKKVVKAVKVDSESVTSTAVVAKKKGNSATKTARPTAKEMAAQNGELVQALVEPASPEKSDELKAKVEKMKQDLEDFKRYVARKEAAKARETAQRMSQGRVVSPKKARKEHTVKDLLLSSPATPSKPAAPLLEPKRSKLEESLARLSRDHAVKFAAATRRSSPPSVVSSSCTTKSTTTKSKGNCSDGESTAASTTEPNDSCDDSSVCNSISDTDTNPLPNTKRLSGFLRRFRRKGKRRGGVPHDEESIADIPSVAGSCCF